VKFKTKRQEAEWNSSRVHPKLREVMTFVEEEALKLDWEVLATDVWRSEAEERKLKSTWIHNAWRAIDIRTIGIDQEKVETLERIINAKFVYDPHRPTLPTAYFHIGTAKHLHIQVNSFTKEK